MKAFKEEQKENILFPIPFYFALLGNIMTSQWWMVVGGGGGGGGGGAGT